MILDVWRSRARALLRGYRVASVCVLLLAVGVTPNVILFAVSDAVMFRSFPFAAQDRLVIAAEHLTGAPRAEVSYANFRDWRLRARTFEGLAAIGSTNWTMTLRTTEPIVVPYRAVSAEFFDVLGTRPALGRTFHADEDIRGARRVVVISDGFWRREFGADPQIVGRSITLSERPFTIVGVMPRGFTYPAGADAWAPLVPDLADIHEPSLPDFVEDRGAAVLRVIGRLKPGVGLGVARADLDRVLRELATEYGRSERVTSELTPLVDDLLGSVRVGLWTLLSAVGLLLLAIVANVAGLMLVQIAARHREFTIRRALGASTAHLVQQLLVETAAIVIAATVCAVIIARAMLPVIQSIVASSIPRADEAAVDVRVIGFAIILAAITSVSCWMIPALHVGRGGLGAGLRTADRGFASGPLSRSGRRWLVATEVAIAVVILAGTGLLYHSVIRLTHVDLGFNPHNLLAVELGLPQDLRSHGSRADVYQFYTRAIEDLATMPVVESVAAVGQRPLKGPIGLDASWEFEGQTPDAAKKNPWFNLEPITPTYFTTIGTHVIAGREFDDRDRMTTEPVVIVNDKLARYAWPGQSAVGKRIRAAGLDLGRRRSTWWTVVGVVSDIRYREIGATTLDVYVPFAQSWFPVGDVMIRTAVPPAALASAVRTRLRQIDRGGIIDIWVMDRVVETHQAPWRTNLLLFGLFAVLTVLVASVGLYAMLAAIVVEQSHEIGVRMALGATVPRIIRTILSEGMLSVIPGVAAGLAAFAASSRLMRTILFEVSPLDMAAWVGAAATLFIVSIAACAIPAVRAARVDPSICLRVE